MKIARILIVAFANIGVLCAAAMPAYANHYTFDGEGGFKQSFSLTGGGYEVYLIAKHPARGYEAPDEKYCSFSGMLERTSPTYNKISLGSAVEVSSDNIAPWKFDRISPLPARVNTRSG